MHGNNENDKDSGENEDFDEDELSPAQALLLYGCEPEAPLPQWGAIKCKDKKAEPAN